MSSNLCNESKYLLIESKNVHYKSRILNMFFQNKFCEQRLLPSAFKQITQKCTLRSRNRWAAVRTYTADCEKQEQEKVSCTRQHGSEGHAGLDMQDCTLANHTPRSMLYRGTSDSPDTLATAPRASDLPLSGLLCIAPLLPGYHALLQGIALAPCLSLPVYHTISQLKL